MTVSLNSLSYRYRNVRLWRCIGTLQGQLKLTGPIIIEVTKILEMFYIILATKASSFPPQKCSCTDMKLSPLALSIPCQVYCCLSV